MADYQQHPEFLLLESRISPRKENTPRLRRVRKLSSANNIPYQNISCEARLVKSNAPKVKVVAVARKVPKRDTSVEDMAIVQLKSNITELSAKVSFLQDEKELVRRNLLNEIEFINRQHLSVLYRIQGLALAKQYQRLTAFVNSQVISFKKRYDQVTNSDLDTIQGQTMSQEVSFESSLESDPSFDKLISNFQENLKQIQLQDMTLLPQIKRLSDENELSTKKLAWFFSQVPFDMGEQEECKSLAAKIVKELGFNKGWQVLELIVKNICIDSLNKQNDENKLKNTIAPAIKRNSKTC